MMASRRQATRYYVALFKEGTLKSASLKFASANARISRLCAFILCSALSMQAGAVGTAVGTVIENTAEVSFDVLGAPQTLQSNTTTIAVAERIDVEVTLQSPETPVDPGESNRALLFSITNTGNGSETFSFSLDSVVAGDDFDPTPAVPGIYFDTDGSGDFNTGDQPYAPGSNDAVLAADESISVFLVNDIPDNLPNGATGRSALTATALTGTGAPGTVFDGLGDGGVNAVIGSSGGEASETGQYLVSALIVNIVKAQLVSDPFGGTEPVPGATLTYTITVDVASAGTAAASVLRDAIPTNTVYVPNSMTLNGAALSDLADGDAGELDTATVPTIVVRLGDLTETDSPQVIVFQTVIE